MVSQRCHCREDERRLLTWSRRFFNVKSPKISSHNDKNNQKENYFLLIFHSYQERKWLAKISFYSEKNARNFYSTSILCRLESDFKWHFNLLKPWRYDSRSCAKENRIICNEWQWSDQNHKTTPPNGAFESVSDNRFRLSFVTFYDKHVLLIKTKEN